MGLETGSYISALVATNPVGATDPKSQGDDHLRFIKAKILETFPNITNVVNATHTELNLVVGATGGLATLSVSFAALHTLVSQMGTFSSSVTSSDITGSIRTPVLQTTGVSAGTYTAATVVIDTKGRITAATANTISSKILQMVNTQSGALAQGTTILPCLNDDTIPQITEGDEYMTRTITPVSATSNLRIDVVFWGNEDSNVSSAMAAALFRDATAGALAAGTSPLSINTDVPQQITFTHWVAAGSATLTTFRVRGGMDQAGTFNFNGGFGGRAMGGVLSSSITITEIAV